MRRITQAVALETPDRVPVVLEYCAFAARLTDTPQSEFLLSMDRAVAVMIEAFQIVSENTPADAINYGNFSPYMLSNIWLSKIKVPGVDLPENVSYQVDETELMTADDYDTILDKGWPTFYREFQDTRVLNDVPTQYWPRNQHKPDVIGSWQKIGIPVLSGGDVAPPFEYLCGARSLENFFLDLMTCPEKLDEVMAHMMPYLYESTCKSVKRQGFPCVWVGGWRSAPEMLSPDMWERFVWQYLRALIEEVIKQGLIPILHLDSCWDRELARFRELPKGKVIMALDGKTDIFRAREILNDHICLMGDVPSVMLFNSTPDDVYEYCSRLIRQVGREGFILQSGCDIPENAKLENVQAMISAAYDS